MSAAGSAPDLRALCVRPRPPRLYVRPRAPPWLPRGRAKWAGSAIHAKQRGKRQRRGRRHVGRGTHGWSSCGANKNAARPCMCPRPQLVPPRPNIFSMLRYKAIKDTHIRCSPAAMLAVPSEVMKSDSSSSSERDVLELAAWPERC